MSLGYDEWLNAIWCIWHHETCPILVLRAGGLTTSSYSLNQCYLINMTFWYTPKVNFTRSVPGMNPWHNTYIGSFAGLYIFPCARASKLNQICAKLNPHLPEDDELNQTLDICKPQCWPWQENNRMYLTQLTPEGCGCYCKLVIFMPHISQLLSRIDIFSISWYCPQLNTTRSHWWLVNIDSGNGLVPDGTKPSLEPILTQFYGGGGVLKHLWALKSKSS